MQLEAKMDALFDAFAAQDVEKLRALCAADFDGRQNGSPPSGFDEMMVMVSETFWNAGLKISYSNIRRVLSDRAVAEQHDVTLARPDGVQVVLDVCVIVRFDEEGFVVSLDEYADTAQLAPLMS